MASKFNFGGLIEEFSTKKLTGKPIFAYIKVKDGFHDYNNGGRWVEPEYKNIEILGVLTKLSNNDLKMAEAGSVTIEDRKLRTYKSLPKHTPIEYDGEVYKVINGVDRSLYDTSGGEEGLHTYFITRTDNSTDKKG